MTRAECETSTWFGARVLGSIMLATDRVSIDDRKVTKFFRAFELSTEYREILYSNRSVFYRLPRMIRGAVEYQFLPYYFARAPRWRVLVRKLWSAERIAPNYVMTGPIKNGSSDLATHLLLHPDVMHPLAKEINSLRDRDWRVYYPTVREKQLRESGGEHTVRCGYLEPFLNNMKLMEKLYRLNPDSKIIITLRDPVVRAYSQWKWEIFLGGEGLTKNPTFASFDAFVQRAIELFPSCVMESACGFPVLQTGIYHQAVEQWTRRFGEDNVLILDSADYFRDRRPTLDRIQRFLDLPVVDIPEYSKKANENPVRLPPPGDRANAMLAEFYAPWNERLFRQIGVEFDWRKAGE